MRRAAPWVLGGMWVLFLLQLFTLEPGPSDTVMEDSRTFGVWTLAFVATSAGLFGTRLRPLLLPVHLAVVALVILSHPLTRYFGRDGSLVVFLVYLVFVVAVCTRVRPQLVALAASSALSLLILESALSIGVPAAGRHPALPDYGTVIGPYHANGFLKPNLDLDVVGEGGPVRFITNSEGLRNRDEVRRPRPPGVLRVVFIGDSFVSGYRVGQDDTVGAVLEARLGARLSREVEVLVVGAGHPDAYRRFVVEAARTFAPDLVLVGLTLGNDLSHAYYAAHDLPFEPGVLPGALLPPDAFTTLPFRRLMIRLDRTLQPWRWYRRLTRAEDRQGISVWAADAPQHVEVFGLNHSLGHFYSRRSLALVESSYDDTGRALAAIAGAHGAPAWTTAVVIFPQRFQVYPADWQALQFRLALDPTAFDLEQPNRRLQALCTALHLTCLDLLDAFRGAAGEPLYLPGGDMHWNTRGHQVAAEAIADAVLEGRVRLGASPAPSR